MEIGQRKLDKGIEGVKKRKQNAKSVISLAKGKKQKEYASNLNDPNQQNQIFRIAKQMVNANTGYNGVKLSERSIG